jgi:hypothetical protein
LVHSLQELDGTGDGDVELAVETPPSTPSTPPSASSATRPPPAPPRRRKAFWLALLIGAAVVAAVVAVIARSGGGDGSGGNDDGPRVAITGGGGDQTFEPGELSLHPGGTFTVENKTASVATLLALGVDCEPGPCSDSEGGTVQEEMTPGETATFFLPDDANSEEAAFHQLDVFMNTRVDDVGLEQEIDDKLKVQPHGAIAGASGGVPAQTYLSIYFVISWLLGLGGVVDVLLQPRRAFGAIDETKLRWFAIELAGLPFLGPFTWGYYAFRIRPRLVRAGGRPPRAFLRALLAGSGEKGTVRPSSAATTNTPSASDKKAEVMCPACSGSRVRGCVPCGSSGYVWGPNPQNPGGGLVNVPCRSCGAQGGQPCSNCHGRGTVPA